MWNLAGKKIFSKTTSTNTFTKNKTPSTNFRFNSSTTTTPLTTNEVKIPKKARVVVIGGGIIGNSVAYHLAKGGWNDIVLLERDRLTSGTTWHAAGLMVTFGSFSETSTEFRKYSKHLYQTLEEESGQSTGFMPVGFIELATNKDRLEEYRRVSNFNRKLGVDVNEISAREVKELFPLCKVEDVLAGFYVKDDGRVNPVDITMSLSIAAKKRGVQIIEGVSVKGIVKKNRRVTSVITNVSSIDNQIDNDNNDKTKKNLKDYQEIEADYVVNCAGMWARQLGDITGVNIPNQAAEHYYLLTDQMNDVNPSWPVIEDPSSYTYIRPEGGGLLIGLFESKAAAWSPQFVSNHFSFGEINPDWERMDPYVEKAMNRVPRSLDVGVKKFFCGPESFTPDLAPILGQSPELDNYFVAAGLNSIGILTGGGVGKMMADWIINGKPDMDVTGVNIDRLHVYQNSPEYRRSRVVESLGLVYKPHYPYYSKQTARKIKRSAIYDRLKEKGAYFKEVSGWEGADWFAPNGVDPSSIANLPLSWGKHAWFDYWKREHEAARNGVILMDMSFMSKFIVKGRHAAPFLNYLSTSNIDEEEGMIKYTQWLNEDGKLEADLTISKLQSNDHHLDDHLGDDDHKTFFVVATDTMHRHVQTWMTKHHSKLSKGINDNVFIQDVTSQYTQLNIQGPKSRDLLTLLTFDSSHDFSNENFPYRSVQKIFIGCAPIICVRITYLGELGYELYIPVEYSLHVYDRIIEEGEKVGLVHAGLKALASLRMEKGYRDYGHDMDNTDTLLEVGLGFTADYNKEGGFLGIAPTLAQKQKGLTNLSKRLVQVLVKEEGAFMFHNEIVLRDGVAVGYIRAASYGHTLGGAVGLAMIDALPNVPFNKDFIDNGKWQVQIAERFYDAQVSLRPLYDPDNLRIKA